MARFTKREAVDLGVWFIAQNDEPEMTDLDEIAWSVSVLTLAAATSTDNHEIARRVVEYRAFLAQVRA